MSKLPLFKKEKVSEEQKENLEKWLFSWYQNKKNITSDDEYIADETITDEQITKLEKLVNPFDSTININEIRLLSPKLVPDIKRPYYVAVIKEFDNNLMLIAPYSPFPIPATPGELNTGNKHFSIANLQLWNAKTIPKVLLKQSWLVDEIKQEDADDAFAVYANFTSGKALPEQLTKRIGLPIINQKDPRIEYQEKENELLLPLQEKILYCEKFRTSIEDKNKTIHFAEFAEKHIQFKQAASSEESQESKCILMHKTVSEIVIDNLFDEVQGKGIIVSSLGFEILNPEYKDVSILQWQLDGDLDVDGSEFVFAIDKTEKTLIGTGIVNIATQILDVDIIYSNLNRIIDSENDIILVLVKI